MRKAKKLELDHVQGSRVGLLINAREAGRKEGRLSLNPQNDQSICIPSWFIMKARYVQFTIVKI